MRRGDLYNDKSAQQQWDELTLTEMSEPRRDSSPPDETLEAFSTDPSLAMAPVDVCAWSSALRALSASIFARKSRAGGAMTGLSVDCSVEATSVCCWVDSGLVGVEGCALISSSALMVADLRTTATGVVEKCSVSERRGCFA